MDRAHGPVSDHLASLYNLRPEEAAFLRSLGIEKLPKTLPHAQEVFIGSVEIRPGGSARIWVDAHPARFWRIEILTCEGKRVRVCTASGWLKPRWGVVSAIATAEVEISLPEPDADDLPVVSLGQGDTRHDIQAADLLPGGGR